MIRKLSGGGFRYILGDGATLVEGKLGNGEEAAPTYCCAAADQHEQNRACGGRSEVAGRQECTSTILEAENACQGQGLVLGSLFRWILAAAVHLLVDPDV